MWSFLHLVNDSIYENGSPGQERFAKTQLCDIKFIVYAQENRER